MVKYRCYDLHIVSRANIFGRSANDDWKRSYIIRKRNILCDDKKFCNLNDVY